MLTAPWGKRKHRTSDAPFPSGNAVSGSSSSSRTPEEYEMDSGRPGGISLGNDVEEHLGIGDLHHRRHDSTMTNESYVSSDGDASIRKGKGRAFGFDDALVEEDELEARHEVSVEGPGTMVPGPRRKRFRFGQASRREPALESLPAEQRTLKERFMRGLLGENKTTGQAIMPDGTPVTLKSLFIADVKAIIRITRNADYKVVARAAMQRTWWKWYAILGIIVVLSVLVTVKHDAIIIWIRPGAQKLKEWPAGWMIPLALLIIVSFPPLVGHEIIGICIGIVWDLDVGFAILAAGTFLGELATWFVFKGLCTGRAAKFQAKNRYYRALTQLIREKSFLFVLVLRFSAVPGHITTALSASAGAHFFSYCMAAILTLPKQLSLVYVGTAFGSKNKTTHTVSIITLFLTIIGTVIAAIYIYYQLRIYLICHGNETSQVTTSEPEMTQVSTLDDVQDLDSKLTAAGYPPPYRPRSGTLPSGEAAPAYTTIQLQKHERRPFIHSNSSFFGNSNANPNRISLTTNSGSRTPSRSRSLGHTAQDDLEAYLASKRRRSREPLDPTPYRDEDSEAPTFVIDAAEDGYRGLEDDIERGNRRRDGNRDSYPPTPPVSGPYLGIPDVYEAGQGSSISTSPGYRQRSATDASMASNASHISEQLLLDLRDTTPRVSGDDDVYVRGTSSMDMWRPSSMTLSTSGKLAEAKHEERRRRSRDRAERIGGREIAKDADEYASRHGARRPDMGRRRGESSAALLGRPETEA
ncbi:hypothetical protein NliqN6_6842 [Naganishia liquefaciens]|uniref:Golgi apparatus membrane protein TVP38 n=1 Tax=Naganishia liquefaciens TaxID=104408 RepID=A0A8H3U082_9TREE|nr:hypothetical protein NliqN6_6842 [Naganishia liquefaciens]